MLNIQSKIEQALLTYYFLNTSAEHHLHEIARLLEVDPANLDKKLKFLTKIGLFQMRQQGNQRLYSLNQSFFLFNEYRSIVNKTCGIENQIKQVLKNITGIKKAFIFGSYAKGGLDQFSDIDLLVVGNQDGLALSSAVSAVEKKVGREINILEIDNKEFTKPKKPFINQILSEKMIELSL